MIPYRLHGDSLGIPSQHLAPFGFLLTDSLKTPYCDSFLFIPDQFLNNSLLITSQILSDPLLIPYQLLTLSLSLSLSLSPLSLPDTTYKEQLQQRTSPEL